MAKKKKFSVNDPLIPLWEAVLILIGLVMTLVSGFFLPHRGLTLLTTIGFPLSVFLLAAEFVFFKGEHVTRIFIWMGLVFLSLMGLVFTVGAYTFYDEPFLPFWRISLILGAVIGVFLTAKLVWRNQKWGIRLLSYVVFAFIAAGGVMITAMNLNYLLDTRPPAEIQTVIKDKHVHTSTRSANTYHFEVTVNGEFVELDVPWTEYRKYDEGDVYTFRKYGGAFGEPFYIAGD